MEPSGQEREDEVTDFYFLVRKLVAALHCRAGGTGVEGRPPPPLFGRNKSKTCSIKWLLLYDLCPVSVDF